MRRQCDCMCCLGCDTNNVCGVFGAFKCRLCKEWRCAKCIHDATLECNYCLRLWKRTGAGV